MTTIEAVYERYARDVYRFAFWLCGDRYEAEDFASETLVRVWAGAPVVAAIIGALGVLPWAGYFTLRHRLRATGP
ncbi:MAG TPA: sigma factor [Gemmatimonadaceae bacterium]|nr:sigma factor [Gemmatimonadaceae bacterium]